MNKIVRSRAPLRLGLAGGGTDVSPYSDLHGGYVLNATIDMYAYTTLEKLNDGIVLFCAEDLHIHEQFFLNDSKAEASKIFKLRLHKATYDYFFNIYPQMQNCGLKLTTYCDAPVGSGLGSSSTLVVSMIHAFVEFLNIAMDDYQIARLAYRIERIDCGFSGGKQDQYSAAFGGINFIEFNADDKVIVNPLRIKNWILCELEASTLLYFTGTSRMSAKIIEDQSQSMRAGKAKSLAAMHKIKAEATLMKEHLLMGNFTGYVNCIQKSWKNKKLSSNKVSNPNIEIIFDEAMSGGALAGKVSGAGGGGFMWFFAPAHKRIQVMHRLQKLGGRAYNCTFTKNGSQAWKV